MRKQGRHEAPKACRHRKTKTRTKLAGMEHVVCETCGRVSVHFLEAHVQDDIYIPGEVLPETG